jgi:S-DNA-T family DNA segregation ATPase FtsK/SpoIIIE
MAERAEARRLLREKREAARLAALAAVETEASMLEDPPTAVARPKARALPGRGGPRTDEDHLAAESGGAGLEPDDPTADVADDAERAAAPSGRAGAPAGVHGVAAVPGIAAASAAAGVAAAGGLSAAPVARPPLPNYSWKLPSLDLLKAGKPAAIPQSEIEATTDLIVDTLAEHGVEVKISQVTAGPTVTMYGIAPGWERARHKAGRGERWEDEDVSRKRVRVDTILAREKDLALALASPNIRFEAPIPGESLVGIEVPNAHPSIVTLRSAMQTDSFREFERKAGLPISLGIASSSGEVFADLTKMPHLLIAGATGSGKSVCMNTIITGFLLTRTPAQVQMILIDPKRVELTPYTGVPHLACPPVVEADRAVLVLKALVKEMMARYAILQSAGAKNIAAYNDRAGASRLPYLVVAIDELADLMLTSANDVERLIVRLAQLGRATGVHLIVATQRPSVDVVTGLIKANFPSRIAFAVSSQVDSRTILDSNGAERLLGRGDMLFLPIDRPKPMRVQGAFLTDGEVEAVVRVWRASGGPRPPELQVEEPQASSDDDEQRGGTDDDSLFVRAQDLARSQARLSTSLLQRRLRIGYPRAARLMDELEDAGIVGAGEPGKPRQVLIHQ